MKMIKADHKKPVDVLWGTILFLLVLAGCSKTYPQDQVGESIQKICRDEYAIENIEVKIIGETIGVYLPIKKLFAVDLKEVLSKAQGKVESVENLFQPAPEAMDQVEDVLFSISRVLLSTEKKLNFYTLQATDVERTGLQLVLTGNVDDIKRVRLWDISREEYRKRILHEIRLNRAVVWHRPVRSLFETLQKAPSLETFDTFFSGPLTAETIESLFFFNPNQIKGNPLRWEWGEFRSTPYQSTQVLVYAPVTLRYNPREVPPGSVHVPSGTLLEYIFVVSFEGEIPQVIRAIPLTYLDSSGKVQKLKSVGEFNVAKDLKTWEAEFPFHEVVLGDFLAEQLTRRTQNLIYMDERIHNTFDTIQLAFRYEKGAAASRPHFSLELEMKQKVPTFSAAPSPALDEDVLYLLNLVSREFVNVLRSYQFSDYEFLRLTFGPERAARIIQREDLELFRQKKIDMAGLIKGIPSL